MSLSFSYRTPRLITHRDLSYDEQALHFACIYIEDRSCNYCTQFFHIPPTLMSPSYDIYARLVLTLWGYVQINSPENDRKPVELATSTWQNSFTHLTWPKICFNVFWEVPSGEVWCGPAHLFRITVESHKAQANECNGPVLCLICPQYCIGRY